MAAGEEMKNEVAGGKNVKEILGKGENCKQNGVKCLKIATFSVVNA